MHSHVKSVLAAGCLLAASTLGAAAFESVTVETAELREGPGWDFAPIVELPEGSIVEVLNCDRRWCEIGIEDYDGFIPRGVLDLGGSPVPLYSFPPQIAAPALWHGRYYSRDHYRYESRARWRDREGRRFHVVPIRPQPRPLRPIGPNERRGQKQFQPGQRQFQPDGPGRQRMIEPDRRGGQPKQFQQRGPSNDQPRIQRGPDQPRIQRGPGNEQPRIQRGPDQQRIQRGPDQPRIQRAPDQPRIQRAPDQPRIQRAPDQPRTTQPQPRPQIQQQAPAQRQAPAQKQQEKKKAGER